MFARQVSLAVVLGALALGLGACSLLNQVEQSSAQEEAGQVAPILTAAGFKAMPADSQHKVDQLEALPQLTMNHYADERGRLHYWTADAQFCRCLYVGDEHAYQRYQEFELEQQMIARREEIKATRMQRMIPDPYGYGRPRGYSRLGFGSPALLVY